METACCGISLRIVALLLLCANLVFNIWGLWSELISYEHSIFKQFLKDNSTFVFMDVCLLMVGAAVFLATIFVIKSSLKSSIALLTVSVFITLFDVFFLLYGMILLNSDAGGMGKILNIDSRQVLYVYMLILATMSFKFYSALVFHNCKIELKEKSFYDTPSRYNVVEKEVSSFGPPAYGENFQYAAPLLKFALYLTKCIY